jgi:hypothetical protein
MHLPELAAQTPQPPLADALPSVQAAAAPQHWDVTVADAKYHWYDLIAGFPQVPDIRDPIGRYFRRMQFDLEAAATKRLLYYVVTRPRVRFDTSRGVQWGFFSLKLTLPLLVGAAASRENLTIELKVPFAATLKKPSVTLVEQFVTLNWGGLVEALSIHDVLQNFDTGLKLPSKVIHVGQTWDPAARLAKGRLTEVQLLHQHLEDDVDMLLLVQQLAVAASSPLGDPAGWPEYQTEEGAALLAEDRSELLAAALTRYFEGASPRHRNHEEKSLRNARLRAIQGRQQLLEASIDLQLPDVGNYAILASEHATPALRHCLQCAIVEGEAVVAPCAPPAPPG